MWKIGTTVIDFYDDNGELLKEVFPDFNLLPEQVKTANFNPPNNDHDYALILNKDGYLFKKFACHDAGNTAISLLYFLENYEKLPDEAVKIAALNLVDSLQRFNLKIPEELLKLAEEIQDRKLEYILDENFDVKHTIKKAEHLILDKYPIDTYEQIKIANDYFDKYWKDFSPAERRDYALQLKTRADTLLANTSELINKYASTEYGDIEVFLTARKYFAPKEEHQTLDLLLEKSAYVKPETFAEALKEFDLVIGLDSKWDKEIKDPYLSTFSKIAEKKNIILNKDGTTVSEYDLKHLAKKTDLLSEQFSKEFVEDFITNPKKVYDSAPENIKKLLTRMSIQRY